MMKKVFAVIVVVFSFVSFFSPKFATASEIPENTLVIEPNIQMLEPATEGIDISPFRQREAIVRNTGSQRLYWDPPLVWSNVTVLTWRSIFFTNGVQESGRTTTRIQSGFFYDTYYYTWTYRVW